MRQLVLADSGPLYAAVDRDDTYHDRSRQELQRFEAAGLDVVVVYPILLEAYTLLLRRLGTRSALRWLDQVGAGASLLNPTSEDFAQAIRRVKGYPDQALTLFDAVLAAVSERLDAPVWTYDHHFDVLATHVWR